MKSKIAWLVISIFPVFYLIFLLFQFLTSVFPVNHPDLLNQLFLYISALSFLMLLNLLLVYVIKPYYTGLVFMIWSMIKLMFIMGFFAFYILPDNLQITNHFVYILVIVYLTYLIYELIVSLLLLNFERLK